MALKLMDRRERVLVALLGPIANELRILWRSKASFLQPKIDECFHKIVTPVLMQSCNHQGSLEPEVSTPEPTSISSPLSPLAAKERHIQAAAQAAAQTAQAARHLHNRSRAASVYSHKASLKRQIIELAEAKRHKASEQRAQRATRATKLRTTRLQELKGQPVRVSAVQTMQRANRAIGAGLREVAAMAALVQVQAQRQKKKQVRAFRTHQRALKLLLGEMVNTKQEEAKRIRASRTHRKAANTVRFSLARPWCGPLSAALVRTAGVSWVYQQEMGSSTPLMKENIKDMPPASDWSCLSTEFEASAKQALLEFSQHIKRARVNAAWSRLVSGCILRQRNKRRADRARAGNIYRAKQCRLAARWPKGLYLASMTD